MADGPAAGWYPDPTQDGQLRWWDGSAWTEHTAPRQPDSLAWPSGDEPGAGGHGQAPGYGSGQGGGLRTGPTIGQPGYGTTHGQGGMSPPDPMLWQSIVFTILCCNPIGIFAIVFAAQANQANRMGNFGEAARRADQAKRAIVVALSVFLGIFALGLIGLVGEGR